MNSTSVIELSKDALKNNISFIREMVGKNVYISSVVKGNAYGHGIKEIVPIIESTGINHFSVFCSQEAHLVFEVAKKSQIMIMGFIASNELEWVISNNISFFVFDLERLIAAIEIASVLNKKARIHIEVETGMNRTGFREHELSNILKLLKSNTSTIEVAGLCTHFAGAESIANHVRITNQIERFENIYNKYFKYNFQNIKKHTACSAAALHYPQTHFDMVRIGILQYGFWPNIESKIKYLTKKNIHKSPLRRVLRWTSKVLSIKEVAAGEFIGYGTNYIAETTTIIAIVPVGYSNGYSRGLSNMGRVLISGQRVSVVGVVNMNMISIDITNIPDVREGDEVVIVGKQGDKEISVASFSDYSNSMNYETLTRLPANIDRITK